MNASSVTFIRVAAVALALGFAPLVSAPAPSEAQTPAKKVVTSAADLPSFTYQIDTAPSELTKGGPAFTAFAAQVRTNLDSLLANYDIADRGTLRNLLQEKMYLQLLSGTENAAALETAEALRGLQDKPDLKLLSIVGPTCVVEARTKSNATAGAAYLAAFRTCFARLLVPLPWAVVGNVLKDQKKYYDAVTPAMMIGQTAGLLDAGAAKSHTLSGDSAAEVVRVAYIVNVLLPEGPAGSAVIGALNAQHTQRKPDIWTARQVTLHASDKLTPVRIAIWDSGSDVTLFPHQLYTDPAPKGTDPHGLAFDMDGFPAHGYLMPLTAEQRGAYAGARAFMQGYSDLGQSIDSPEAAATRKEIAALKPEQVGARFEQLGMFAIYAHGTEVADTALRGNPAAQLVVARITYDYKNTPTAPTDASTNRDAANFRTYIEYFKAHRVRIVNMSWGGTPAGLESILEKNNIGKDAADRKTIAMRYYTIERNALYDAIKNAPGILFVTSAGNADANSTFNETMPASFDLPNLLVVGAVDQAGEDTTFTSYGKTVLVDANGSYIASKIPGGGKLNSSGTSIAAPMVTNLAGKLLAVDPSLTPVRTIALIRAGATTSADGKRHNIDPKRSVALLKKKPARR